MSDVRMIPKLRCWPKADGTLRFNRWQGPQRPDDESWWRDVLHDPRAGTPSGTRIANERDAHWRLDRQSAEFYVDCPCGRSGRFIRDEAVERVGGDMNVKWFSMHALKCGAWNKMTNWCRARVRR